MPSIVILLTMLSLFGHYSGLKGAENRRYGLDGWIIDIRRDRFTGQVGCHLSKGHRLYPRSIVYSGGALGFRFGATSNAAEAWYRLDGGPPHRAADDDPTLIKSGAPTDTGDLLNPSGGFVWIPADVVGEARTVDIRLSRRSGVVEFHPSGFQAALDAARANGCSPDTAYTP